MFKRTFLYLLIFSSLNIFSQSPKFQLGQMLFFDKVISGNKNISCATCHHPMTGTSDALSLGVGEGGQGLGVARSLGKGDNKVHERIPRNSPQLFNLGNNIIKNYFHDGRVALKEGFPSNVKSPVGKDLPEGLDSVLAAQALFPITSNAEMAGNEGENSIADAASEGNIVGANGVWEQVLNRIKSVKSYLPFFKKAYPFEVRTMSDINIVHYANAIAEFEKVAFKTINTPYHNYLRGDVTALSKDEIAGKNIFFGKGRCFTCHSGELLTDNQFHSIAFPQIGPGKGDGFRKLEDFGREKVTGEKKDRYKFRTPSLINVSVTAPYGHSGAFTSLKDVIKHHLNPKQSLENYNEKLTRMKKDKKLSKIDFSVMQNKTIVSNILASSDIVTIELTDKEISNLEKFLLALTDPACLDMHSLIPETVPSGLPVFD